MAAPQICIQECKTSTLVDHLEDTTITTMSTLITTVVVCILQEMVATTRQDHTEEICLLKEVLDSDPTLMVDRVNLQWVKEGHQ